MNRHLRSLNTGMRGFTLIEALVALVVLSIGMLGIAALYVESLKAGRTAIYRTQAVALAADMADRIRANPVPDPALVPPHPETAAIHNAYQGTGAAIVCVSHTVNCTRTAMAAQDVFFWHQRIADLLPGGNGSILHTADAGPLPDQYTITVNWSEVGQGEQVTYQLQVKI